MFIPLYDTNRLRHIRLQYVTIGLIVVNALVYLATTIGGENFNNAAVLGLGFIPSVVHDKVELSPEFIIIPESLSYVTYSFLHADIFHLGGNMLFLWVFGDNVEDALGHIRYLIFYLLCAMMAWYSFRKQWSLIPVLGLISCCYLLTGMAESNWKWFSIWLVIGLVCYFAYGYRKSRLATAKS